MDEGEYTIKEVNDPYTLVPRKKVMAFTWGETPATSLLSASSVTPRGAYTCTGISRRRTIP